MNANEIKTEEKLEHLNANQLVKAKSIHSEIQIVDNQLDISQDIMSNTLKNLQDKMKKGKTKGVKVEIEKDSKIFEMRMAR